MGFTLRKERDQVYKPIRSAADIEKLEVINTFDDLGYVTDAVSTIRRELNGRVPLIGFSGSPWTLATYMIEGQSSRDFARSKTMLYTQPELMHQLLDKLALSVIDYLNAQIASGAQAVQIFDTWGGVLSHSAYKEFSPLIWKKLSKVSPPKLKVEQCRLYCLLGWGMVAING